MASYLLYVVDQYGRAVGVEGHNRHNQLGRIRTLSIINENAFTIVLESEDMYTYFVMDEEGDIVIEQEDKPEPKPEPKKRKSRYNWRKNSRR